MYTAEVAKNSVCEVKSYQDHSAFGILVVSMLSLQDQVK